MKKMFGLVALLAISSLPTLAQAQGALKQDTPSFEVGGGYTFRSLNVPFGPRLTMHGWNGTVDFNINNWLGVAMDIDGTRNDQGTNGLTNVYSAMVGPRIYPVGHHSFTPFGVVQFGLAHANITFPTSTDCAPFCTSTDGSFAVSLGGGVDLTLTKHFGIRLGEFDYERTGMFLAGSASGPGGAVVPHQNNYKYKAALLIRFGSR